MTEYRVALLAVGLALALVGCGPAPSSPGSMTGAGDPMTAMPATTTIGAVEVSASVVPTSMLNATIRARYDVTQTRDRVLIVVALRADGHAQTASVSGRARDLRGVAQTLAFREVRVEDDLIDYAAIARASAPDTLRLDLDIVTGDGQRAELRFSRDLVP